MFESLTNLFNMLGLERSLGTRIVSYADDLVILCSRLDREEEADFRRCVLGQTDSEIETAMGKQVAAQALLDVESRQQMVQTLRRN